MYMYFYMNDKVEKKWVKCLRVSRSWVIGKDCLHRFNFSLTSEQADKDIASLHVICVIAVSENKSLTQHKKLFLQLCRCRLCYIFLLHRCKPNKFPNKSLYKLHTLTIPIVIIVAFVAYRRWMLAIVAYSREVLQILLQNLIEFPSQFLFWN